MPIQRRYERVGFFRELTLTASTAGKTLPAHSFDVNLGGVGLVAGILLQRGEPVRVGFHLKDADGRPVVENVMGRIAYGRADEGGNYMGVEFLEPIQPTTHPELTRALLSL